jgi:hypothetical protein
VTSPGVSVILSVHNGETYLRQAVARIPLRALRYAVSAVAAPLSALLLGLDRLAVVRRSAFLSSFTTGFLAVTRKA